MAINPKVDAIQRQKEIERMDKNQAFVDGALSSFLQSLRLSIMSAEYVRARDGEEFVKINKRSGNKQIDITGRDNFYSIAFEVIYNL